MFNFFKNKLHNLIPSDVKNGLLTSNFCQFKVGDKIVIPENIICYVTYKDKTYKELTSDTYALDKDFILDLYKKQLKNKKKLKNIKADLYFVNLNNFTFEFEFADKIVIDKSLTSTLINVSISLKVDNPKNFSKFVINEVYGTNSNKTNNLTTDFCEEIIKRHFLHKKLNNINLSIIETSKLKEFLTKHLSKVGLMLIDVDLKLFKKANNTKHQQKCTTLQEIEPEQTSTLSNENEKIVDQTSNFDYTKQDNELCPNCKTKKIKGSAFCHKCGTKY